MKFLLKIDKVFFIFYEEILMTYAWAHEVAELLSPYKNRPWLIAISGGCDSVVLYHLICHLFPKQQRIILHANHQIQKQSQEWVVFTRDLATKNHDFFITKDLVLKNHSEKEARKERYAFFQEVAKDYTNPLLIVAHHVDDADETALWRFLRGAPLGGIRGIAQSSTVDNLQILRPLINVSRRKIEDYAEKNQLAWVQDPSNSSNTYTRNFLRNAIIGPLKDRSLFNIQQSRQRLDDDYDTLMAHQSLYLKNPWVLELQKYPLVGLSHQRSLMQNWLSRHQQLQPSYDAMTEFLSQCHGNPTTTPLLQLPDEQVLAYYQGQIWRESPLWWSTPVPEPEMLSPKSGSWGLVRFSGLNCSVLIRRLRKNDRLPGEQKAQDYWRQIGLPPWRRPFYPLVEKKGIPIQYGAIWHHNTCPSNVNFDWGALRDIK